MIGAYVSDSLASRDIRLASLDAGFDSKPCCFSSRQRVVLHPTFDAAFMAKSRQLSLGVRHMTPDSLVSSLWDVWGDGRRIVGGRYRLLKIRSLLGEYGFQESLGTAQAFANLIYRASAALFKDGSFIGADALGGAISEEDDWQARALSLIDAYLDACEADGLIELGAALMRVLPQMESMDVLVSCDCLLDEPYAGVFGNAPNVEFEATGSSSSNDLERIVSSGGLKLLVPSGPGIQSIMVAEQAVRFLSDDPDCSVVIYTDEAKMVVDALLPACEFKRGVAVVDSVPVGSSLAGQAVWGACRLWRASTSRLPLHDGMDLLACAVDFALSPYSQIGSFDAADLPSQSWRKTPCALDASSLDALWRGDRTLCASDYVRDLLKVSKALSGLHKMLDASSRGGSGCQHLISAAMNDLRTVAFLSLEGSPVELAACNRIEADLMAAVDAGLSAFDALEATIASSVTPKRLIGVEDPGSIPSVSIVPLHAGPSMGSAAFDHAIVADVSDAAFNSKDGVDPLRSISAALGVGDHPSASMKSQVAFDAAVASARQTLTFAMSLHDAGSEEAFPSFCFESLMRRAFGEGVDARAVLANPASLVEGSDGALLELLSEGVEGRGEDDVAASVGSSIAKPLSVGSLPLAQRGVLEGSSLLESLSFVERDGKRIQILSPSAMEAYLSCPYRWFIERVVSPESLDEDLGPLETGSFAHLVLERFYGKFFEESGKRRPVKDDIELVSRVLDAVFEEALEEQRGKRPCSGRYIPMGHIEGLAAERLHGNIRDSIVRQMDLPEAFAPYVMEMEINPESADEPDSQLVMYAGFALRGRVDRVDASCGHSAFDSEVERGAYGAVERFYVLDYKGSARSHEAGTAIVGDSGLPRYVQTLVYAQALRRIFGPEANCVGALYTSYRARQGATLAMGSWSCACPELSAVSDAKSRVDDDFGGFLDDIEEMCARQLEGLASSKIPNAPAFPDSCSYCPFAKAGRCSL